MAMNHKLARLHVAPVDMDVRRMDPKTCVDSLTVAKPDPRQGAEYERASLECAATALTDVLSDRPFRIACIACPDYSWHVERFPGAFLFTDDATVAGFAAPMADAIHDWLKVGGDLTALQLARQQTASVELPDLGPAASAVHQRFGALLADWESPSWQENHTSIGWLRRWDFELLVEHWSALLAIADRLQANGRLTYAETRRVPGI